MRKLLFLFAFVMALGAPKGFSQVITPAAAGQCNATNGTGGWTLQSCSGSSSTASIAPVLLPVANYGAVADATGAAGVGTNNTTAIQNCINAVQAESPALTPAQGCLLGPGLYRITSPISITKSGVQLWGSAPGAWSFNTSNQLIGKAPISALIVDSATSDGVDINIAGSVGSPVSFNGLHNFSVIKTVADTGSTSGSCKSAAGTGVGSAGINIQFAGGFTIDGVWSEEFACGFYFQNAGAYGTGYVQNSGVMWAANGFNPTVPVYGFLVNGLNSAESFRLRDSFVQTLYPGYSGVTSIGLLVTGANLNDIMVSRFETGFLTYGEYFQSIGASTIQASSDIHLLEVINDTYFNTGIYITGLAAANGGAVEINGGWDTSSTGAGVQIQSSSGVSVSNVQFGNNGSQGAGVIVQSSSNVTVNGNLFANQSTAALDLITVSDSTFGNNVFSGKSGNTSTMILGTGVTRSIFEGNSMGGFASVGISLDSTSSNNTFTGVKAIDPANITTQVSNAGVGNTFDGLGGLIQRQTLGSTATSVTFSSIPAIYTNLHLIGSFQEGGGGTNVEMQFNGDTGAHYAYGSTFTSSSTPFGINASAISSPIVIIGTGGSIVLDVPNYTSTTFGNTYWSSQGGAFASNQGGSWAGTAPITSIKLFDAAGASFSVGSSFSLYGLN